MPRWLLIPGQILPYTIPFFGMNRAEEGSIIGVIVVQVANLSKSLTAPGKYFSRSLSEAYDRENPWEKYGRSLSSMINRTVW